MSEKQYHVIYTGVLFPGVEKKAALSNLVLELGMSEEKAKELLERGQVLLKRCDTDVEAKRLADRFISAGLYCVVDERGSSGTGGDSILMSIFTKFSREKK